MSPAQTAPPAHGKDDDAVTLGELLSAWTARRGAVAVVSVMTGIAGAAIAFALPPIFTARTVIVPPQQGGGGAASALGSLGALGALAGLGAIKSPAEQYVALMTSATVEDRIIDRFKLIQVYEQKYRVDTRTRLEKNVNVAVGKKDGLISIEVDDVDPKRAADMANAFVDGLRFMTNTLAVTEAQQRRTFFENKLRETKDALAQAQIALQASGYNPGAIKAEPAAAAQGYAKLQAERAAAQVRLQTLRSALADTAPDVTRQQATVNAIEAQLGQLEKTQDTEVQGRNADYITNYREFKYQQTLFELFARQYELARVDESREGALVQVVDAATPPEKKSKPRRLFIAIGAMLAGLAFSSLWVMARYTRSTR